MCVESGIWLSPKKATAGELSTALGLPVTSVECSPLGDGNEGALSAMARLKLTFGEESTRPLQQTMVKPDEVSSVVIKCVPKGAERLFTDPWDMFRKEVKFYEILAKETPIRTPKVVYSKMGSGPQGVLLFEDLSKLDQPVFSNPWVEDAKLQTTVQRANDVITQLAAMHAKFWNSPRFEGGGDLEYFAQVGKGLPLGSKITSMHHFFYNSGWPKYKTNGLFDTSGELGQLGEALLTKFPDLYRLMYAPAPHTLIHGDTGVYNMMFYEGDKMCLFDWQFCQMGRGIFDVAFFLALSVGTEMLEQNETAFLDLYLSKLKDGGVENYNMASLKDDYKVALVTAWSIIVYVTSLLASKGPSWDEPIKIASIRTIKAVERTGAHKFVLQQLS